MSHRLQAYYRRLRTFLERDVWLEDLARLSGHRRWMVPLVRVLLLVYRGFFFDHQCLLRASALTYTTLLALIPMLAFMFAFLKGLGGHEVLEQLLVGTLSVTSHDTISRILEYVSHIEVRTLGTIGLGALVFTTLLQVSAIENAFNAIWGIQTGRSLARKLTDYAGIMVIGPVVLLLVTGVNTAFRHQTLVTALLEQRLIGDAMVLLFTCLPYFALWLVFALFYAFLPNTRVRLVPALIGGFIGGTLWQGAQWVYIEFQIGVAGYAAIYGALAQLPLLIAWIYTSWVITLLGAEVTFACQHIAQVPLAWKTHLISVYRQEWLVSALYFAVVETFRAGTTPWSATAFAQQQQVPLSLVRELVTPLCEAHLLVEVTAAPGHYVPGRDPATITPWHVLHTLRHHSDTGVGEHLPPGRTLATTLMMHIEDAIQKVAGAQTMTQWLTEDYTSAEPDTSEGSNAP